VQTRQRHELALVRGDGGGGRAVGTPDSGDLGPRHPQAERRRRTVPGVPEEQRAGVRGGVHALLLARLAAHVRRFVRIVVALRVAAALPVAAGRPLRLFAGRFVLGAVPFSEQHELLLVLLLEHRARVRRRRDSCGLQYRDGQK